MGGVANCCSTREADLRRDGDKENAGILTPLSQDNGGVSSKDEANFREYLWHKWRQHKVEISTFGGQTEGAILVEA